MRTKIRTAAFYDRFKCLGADCPQNCCGGWYIPVDPDALKMRRRISGPLRVRYELSLADRKVNPRFSRFMIRCPLYDPDGLCSIHKKMGEAFLPEVCRQYPREHANLGEFVEKTLDLSCVEAARLFLESENEEEWGLFWYEETGIWEEPRSGNNDDKALLDYLTESREDAISRVLSEDIDTPEKLDECIYHLADEAKLKQNEVLRTDEGGMRRIRLFPFSIMLINELMSTYFFDEGLKWTQPVLYKMCRQYYRAYDPLTEIQGQDKLDKAVERFFSGEEGRKRLKMKCRYIAYSFMRTWFETYEDYSFLRRINEAAVHANMVLLFELLAIENGRELNERVSASIISAYEKRVWHNSDVMDNMMRQLGKRFV